MVSKTIQNIYDTNKLATIVRPTNYTFFIPTATNITGGIVKVGNSLMIKDGILDVNPNGYIMDFTTGTDQLYQDVDNNLSDIKFEPFEMFGHLRGTIGSAQNKDVIDNLNEYFLRINLVCNTLISRYAETKYISSQFDELSRKWQQTNTNVITATNHLNQGLAEVNQAVINVNKILNELPSKVDVEPIKGKPLIADGKITAGYLPDYVFEQLEWVGDWNANSGKFVVDLRIPEGRMFRKGDVLYVVESGYLYPDDEGPLLSQGDRLVFTGPPNNAWEVWTGKPGVKGQSIYFIDAAIPTTINEEFWITDPTLCAKLNVGDGIISTNDTSFWYTATVMHKVMGGLVLAASGKSMRGPKGATITSAYIYNDDNTDMGDEWLLYTGSDIEFNSVGSTLTVNTDNFNRVPYINDIFYTIATAPINDVMTSAWVSCKVIDVDESVATIELLYVITKASGEPGAIQFISPNVHGKPEGRYVSLKYGYCVDDSILVMGNTIAILYLGKDFTAYDSIGEFTVHTGDILEGYINQYVHTSSTNAIVLYGLGRDEILGNIAATITGVSLLRHYSTGDEMVNVLQLETNTGNYEFEVHVKNGQATSFTNLDIPGEISGNILIVHDPSDYSSLILRRPHGEYLKLQFGKDGAFYQWVWDDGTNYSTIYLPVIPGTHTIATLDDISPAYVNITNVPQTAIQGTLTEDQMSILNADPNNAYIMFYGEKFYPQDISDGNGYRVYTHHGETASKVETSKFIYLTLSTGSWVMNVNMKEDVSAIIAEKIAEAQQAKDDEELKRPFTWYQTYANTTYRTKGSNGGENIYGSRFETYVVNMNVGDWFFITTVTPDTMASGLTQDPDNISIVRYNLNRNEDLRDNLTKACATKFSPSNIGQGNMGYLQVATAYNAPWSVRFDKGEVSTSNKEILDLRRAGYMLDTEPNSTQQDPIVYQITALKAGSAVLNIRVYGKSLNIYKDFQIIVNVGGGGVTPKLIYDTSTEATGTYSFLPKNSSTTVVDNISNFNYISFAAYTISDQRYSITTIPVSEWLKKEASYPLHLITNGIGAWTVYPNGNTGFICVENGNARLRRIWAW